MLEGFESAIRDRFRVEEYSKVNKACDLREVIPKERKAWDDTPFGYGRASLGNCCRLRASEAILGR